MARQGASSSNPKKKPAQAAKPGKAGSTPRSPRADGPTKATQTALLTRLRNADVVLIHDERLALALQYASGGTPLVVACGAHDEALPVLRAAREARLPMIHVPQITPDDLHHFVPGAEVPEMWYRPVAQALTLLYKAQPLPSLVRFLDPPSAQRASAAAAHPNAASWAALLETSPLHIEVGTGIYKVRDDLDEPLMELRQRIASEMGLLLSPIALRLNTHLEADCYQIRLRDVPLHEGTLELPVDSAEKLYVIVNRLKQVIYRHGWELLGYSDVELHLDLVRKNHTGLVAHLFPTQLSLVGLRQILRNLLREQLSIRDLVTILEMISEHLPGTQDPNLLTECVRAGYSRSLCARHSDRHGVLHAITLHSDTEQIVSNGLREADGLRWLDLDPESALRLLRVLESTLKAAATLDLSPVLLTSPSLRRFVSRLVEPIFPDLAVLSYNEIAPLCEVRSVGTVQM